MSDSDEEANLRFYNAIAERQKLKRKKIEMQNEDGLVYLQHSALVVCHNVSETLRSLTALPDWWKRNRWREMLKEGSPIR